MSLTHSSQILCDTAPCRPQLNSPSRHNDESTRLDSDYASLQNDHMPRENADSIIENDESDLPIYTTPQLAKRLQVPPSTLVYWRQRREGPPFARIGKYVRYLAADVDNWLSQRKAGVR